MAGVTPFDIGEAGDNGPTNPIETIGARYGISQTSVHGGFQGEPSPPEPYLMPSTKYRNGGTERVADSIGLTPLGGLMPGPNAIAPAVMVGGVGTTFPVPTGEPRDFHQGVAEGYPEGCPVPVK